MTAALATIAFLAAAWIALVALAFSLDGRLAQIGAALLGRQPAGAMAMKVPVRARYSARRPRAAVVRPRLRAAA